MKALQLFLVLVLAPLMLGASSSAIRFPDVGNLGGYQGTDWVDSGASVITATTSNPTKGTIVTDSVKWRRDGGDMILRWDYQQSATGSSGTGAYLLQIPGGYTIDSTRVCISTTPKCYVGGGWMSNNSDALSGTTVDAESFTYDSTHLQFTGMSTTSTRTQIGSGLFSFANTANITYSVTMRIPIQGWNTATPNGSGTTSEVDVYNSGGQGSTNDKVVIFSTVATNTGTDITYATSATLGDSFTVNTTGLYGITYCIYASTNQSFAISIGATGTTAAGSLAVGNVLNSMNIGGNLPTCIPYFGTIAGGSVIRAHTPGTMATSDTRIRFHITRFR